MTQAPNRRYQYILDFDGTITKSDTISVLFQLALSHSNNPLDDPQKSYDEIISAYSKDYSTHLENYTPSSENRHTLASELAFLRSLSTLEQASFQRVSESGILRGVDFEPAGREELRLGERVQIREGFKSFIEMIIDERYKTDWAVLSVNFSCEFITGVIREELGEKETRVISNSVDPQTGVIYGPKGKGDSRIMATCDDKRRYLHDLLDEWGAELSDVVYVGDSATDLECLIDVGVGIVVVNDEEESSLLKTLSRIGVQVVHISQLEVRKSSDEKCLFWARNFEEMLDSGLVHSK